MNKNISHTANQIALYFILLLIMTSCSSAPQAFGVLEGQVKIGPLEPVAREGEEKPTPAPEVYTSRTVVVFKAKGQTEFIQIQLDPHGNYRADLPVGIYTVDINHLGIDSAQGLPQEIEIKANTVTVLDIEIDTGIR